MSVWFSSTATRRQGGHLQSQAILHVTIGEERLRPRQRTDKCLDYWIMTQKYSKHHWPFQEPKLEVPTIYKAYVRPM